MNVEVVTIGDELLLGFTIDTNAAFLARELAELGAGITYRTTCGDSPDAIATAITLARSRADGVITTGGLGPTADDRTRAAVAAALGRALHRDETVVARLEEMWRARGRTGPLPAPNYQQALILEGARVLRNDHGTAPGILVEEPDGKWLAMLPGVPREMREMFAASLRPWIAARAATHTVIRSRTIRTTGIAESSLAARLGDLATGIGDCELAFLPGTIGVDLRLTVRGLAPDAADATLADAVTRIRAVAGDVAYGEGAVDLAAVVLDQMRRERLRLALAESCTGGLLGARITAVPGSSDVFHGGIVAYDNRVKRQLLGVLDADLVAHGAVSEPVARQMAHAVRVRLGTEIAIAVTGVAGPGGGTPGKPVGTMWIALEVGEGRPPVPHPAGTGALAPHSEARLFQLVGDRDEIRQRAAQSALDMLRRLVLRIAATQP